MLVGEREHPQGAMIVLPGEKGTQPPPVALSEHVGLIHPKHVIDILCMQERVFGTQGLPAPDDLS